MQPIDEIYRQRLAMLIEESGGQTKLANRIGKSPSQVNQWLHGAKDKHGNRRALSRHSARSIEAAVGKPEGWMDQPLGIEHRTYRGGSPLDADDSAPPSDFGGLPDDGVAEGAAGYSLGAYVQIRRVRLKLSAGVSGFGVEYLADDEEEPLWFLRSFIAKQGWRADKLLALKVKGRSMEPGLTEGDTVLINTASQEPKDGIAFAVNYEGEAVIKRLVRDAGQWWLVSDNPDQTRYPRKLCDEHVRIVGEVVQKQSLRI